MELNRCSRCGSFYVSTGNVCPKCSAKDGFEFSNFKSYIIQHGFEKPLEDISGETGISTRNINRFLGYQEFKDLQINGGVNAKNANNSTYNTNDSTMF